jgi:LmeA-like phospholipid-binding
VSRRVVVLLVALLVLAGVLVIGDRVAAAYAQNSASNFLVVHAPFDEKPTVRVRGVPFLTQALRGRYEDVEVSGGGLQLGDISGASLDAHLRGVHLGLGDLVKRDVHQLAIDHVDGNVTLPYSELARLSGVSGLTLASDAGAVKVTLGVSVPLIGRVQLSGTADIVLSGSNIRLKVTKLAAVGVSVPSLLLSQFSQAVQVPIAIPTLPYGLMITSVAAADTGVVVHGAASNVVLTAAGS